MDLRWQRNLPRGLRNNNPGNLRRSSIAWQGKVPHAQSSDRDFEQFTTMQAGVRAMATDIVNDIVRDRKNTLRLLITEYAPPNENDTTGYINQVAKRVGISPDAPIDLTNDLLKKIIQAKIIVENGVRAAQIVPGAVIEAGINSINAATKKRVRWVTAGSLSVLFLVSGLLFFF